MAALSLNDLLNAYANGIFPMSEDRTAPHIFWVDPDWRGILPLERFHVPRRLARTVRQKKFDVRIDTAFRACIEACAEPQAKRGGTWINDTIIELYCALNARGFAHSVECWRSGRLVGGLYGVSLGGAFFGESMFSRSTDASKVALVHLVARLKAGNYILLDTQFVTEHLMQFGAVEIARADYQRLLKRAISREADFYRMGENYCVTDILQSITQTS